jgi:GNAT superfamily N-acetyltransferase
MESHDAARPAVPPLPTPPYVRLRRGSRTLTVRPVRTVQDRAEVVGLRTRYPGPYPVPAWDAHDERAFLVLCREGDRAVGTLRLTLHLPGAGDLLPYFPDLSSWPAADGRGFASVGRVLVDPAHRSTDVTAALIAAGGAWYAADTGLTTYAAAVLPRVVRFNRLFGAREVTGPVPAEGFPEGLVLMTGALTATAERAADWLSARGWQITRGAAQ